MTDIKTKKLRAVVLLSTGLTQAQVAQELGVSVRTLQRWVKESEFQTTRQDVSSDMTNATVKATVEHFSNTTNAVLSYEHRRNLIWKEYEDLEIATQSIMTRVREGDLRAIHTLVKISERRCRLLALDMPKHQLVEAALLCAQFGLLKEHDADKVVNKAANFFEGYGLLDEESEVLEEC